MAYPGQSHESEPQEQWGCSGAAASMRRAERIDRSTTNRMGSRHKEDETSRELDELVVVVVGERGVEVRIVHRRTVVDGHEVDEAGRGEKRLVNRDLSQAVGPSQVLHGVPRPGRSAESGFNPRVSGLGNPRPN